VTIAFRHGDTLGEIGYEVLLHSLLSTVAVRLEGGEWGSRFPCIMLKLYRGRLDAADGAAACAEWRDMQAGLAALPPCRRGSWCGISMTLPADRRGATPSAPGSLPWRITT
jgi:hypothetical protein